MIKSILKRIFPITFLKKAFLVLNRLKIGTWDKVFFREKFIPNKEFLVYEEVNPFLAYKVAVDNLSQEIQNNLKLWLDPSWRLDQYILHFKESAFLEPHHGWAITLNNRLIYPSLGFSRAPYVRKPSWFGTYVYKKKVIHISKIISLRDTGEENYFHFYNDVLPKLFLIKDYCFDLRDFTIVISKKLFNKEYFQFFLTNSWLKQLNFHAQDTEWISFEEVIFCKPYTHTKKYFETAVQLVRPITTPTRKSRRIFLTRTNNSLRFIENMKEIKHLLNLYKFEIVDSANMKVAHQIELFSDCEYLIAVHGAGIANIIFRQGKPLTMLEIIHPSEYIPFHYIMLAHIYDYHYNILLGKKGKLKNIGGFRIEPDQFHKELEAMTGDSN